MILGIGTDIIKIFRFVSWKKYSKKQMLKIFTEKELDYFYCNGELNLQSIAIFFSAKEAFYKALSVALIKLNKSKKEFSFLSACKNIEIQKPFWGVPFIKINKKNFEQLVDCRLPEFYIDLSLSHERDFALAFVIISK